MERREPKILVPVEVLDLKALRDSLIEAGRKHSSNIRCRVGELEKRIDKQFLAVSRRLDHIQRTLLSLQAHQPPGGGLT